MIKQCLSCDKDFMTYRKVDRGKYCSKECYYKGRWGASRKITKKCMECGTKFDTFPCRIPLNPNYCSQACYHKNYKPKKGFKHIFKLPHPSWFKEKDEVSYSGIHTWLRNNYDKPKKCEFCDREKSLDWANISGNYLKDRNDYLTLCRLCHYWYDREKRELKTEETV